MSESAKTYPVKRNRNTTWLLTGLAVVMFGFGFALVPLYGLFCQLTGTQSLSQRDEIGRVAVSVDERIDQDRWVTVKFDTTVHPDLPWEFKALTQQLRVHPGATYDVNFSARNRSSERVTGQAIPNIAPWQATPYFTKIDCFCFNRQTLDGEQQADMPLRFSVATELPEEIRSLTLSYSFMRLKRDKSDNRGGPRGLITRVAQRP
jgi:cytochrome c oxidase assembly protein subunit 11